MKMRINILIYLFPFSLILFSISLILVTVVRRESNTPGNIKSYGVDFKFLWDPYSQYLEEWQIYKWPVDIIAGPARDLLVCDASKGQIIRFSMKGQYKEIIGRKGAGPGEFNHPMTIAFNNATSELWVIDRSLGRISTFELNERRTSFTGTIPTPQFQHSRYPSLWKLIIQAPDMIWIAALENDRRIHRINRNGGVEVSFGEKWVPDNAPPEVLSSLNEGTLIGIGEDSLAFVWKLRPRIEIWDTGGNLLSDHHYWLPEFDSIYEYSLPGIEEKSFWYYNADVFFDNKLGTLFLCIASREFPYVIYEFDLMTLQALRRFYLPKGDRAGNLGIHIYTAGRTESGLVLFSIDTQTYGIVSIELGIQ